MESDLESDGLFTFSVGTEDGRGECESLAERGGDPEEELWARRHLRAVVRVENVSNFNHSLTWPRLLPAMLKKRLARKPRAWTAGPIGTERG